MGSKKKSAPPCLTQKTITVSTSKGVHSFYRLGQKFTKTPTVITVTDDEYKIISNEKMLLIADEKEVIDVCNSK